MSTQGPNSPGTLASDSTLSGSTIAWTNPSNAAASDDSRATATVAAAEITHYLKCTNFGFTIPDGSTIDGIEVKVERHADAAVGSDLQDHAIKLHDAVLGYQGANKAVAATWDAMDTVATYGGAADTWSFSPTVSKVNQTGFGVGIGATNVGANPTTARIDHVTITITYTEPMIHTGKRRPSVQARRGVLEPTAEYQW